MNLIILDYSSLLEYEMQRIKFEHSLLYIRVACGAGRVLLSACGLCGPSFFVAGLRPASSPQQARTISDSTEFIIHEWKIFTRY